MGLNGNRLDHSEFCWGETTILVPHDTTNSVRDYEEKLYLLKNGNNGCSPLVLLTRSEQLPLPSIWSPICIGGVISIPDAE